MITGIFHEILSIPRNIVMNMNKVISTPHFKDLGI